MNKTKTIGKKIRGNLFEIITLTVYAVCYFLFIIFLLTVKVVGLYICGLLMLFCLPLLIVQPLVSDKKIRLFEWISVSICFVSFIVIASIYIASIPEENFRVALLTLTSSSIGGLLTLFGVGLTVKYARLERKEEELKRLKPNVFPISETTWAGLQQDKKTKVLFEINEEWSEPKKTKSSDKSSYYLESMLIGNSDISLSVLCGILINGKLIKSKYDTVLLKNSFYLFIIDYRFQLPEEIKTVSLILEDMLHNLYEASMNFEVSPEKKKGSKSMELSIKSVFDISIVEDIYWIN